MSLGEKGGGADSKEAFVYGHHGTELEQTEQPLPPALERRREEVQRFKETCHEAFCELLDKISIAMKLPVKFFAEAHFIGNNSLSFINYPPISKEESDTASTEGSRAGAHKDWGTITLLFQEENGTPGLEIFLPDADVVAAQSDKPYVLTKDTDLIRGRWVAAPVIAGSVLINVGLALETWTNGLYKANLHRVVFPTTAESNGFPGRRSIAFFSQPRLEVVLNPVSADGTIAETPGALTSEQFFLERMKAAAAY
ncbi:hypothetical protein BCR35DRAFT_338204 [Leucosporidium creatinivorum]|uniref:Fe2OG dioxygenase domain-containing protein n=1 Tax=Leucosporidium creatinivorum TaxID=106004 RepID=A0A1Y2FZK0_9BASI|nr:hypothetical protein BCR35DRAFT_338204 [Leucosporidium creatinivorum]